MSKRINITLPDDQYQALKDASLKSGASLGEIVRRTIASQVQGRAELQTRLAAIDSATGLWSNREPGIEDQIRSNRIDFRDFQSE